MPYSRTSMAQNLIPYSPGLASTIIMVPMGPFTHNTPWMAKTTLARTIFGGPKPVRAIEVLLYLSKTKSFPATFFATISKCKHLLWCFPASLDFCHLLSLSSLICLVSKVANIANNMDPVQTAPKGAVSLIRVYIVCFHDKIQSEVHLSICSRRKMHTTFLGQKNGRLKVQLLTMGTHN